MRHFFKYLPVLSILCVLGLRSAAAEAIKPETYFQVANLVKTEAEATENQSLKERLLEQSAGLYEKCAAEASPELAENALQLAAACLVQAGGEDALARAMTITLLITEGFPKGKFAAPALLLRGDVFMAKHEWGRAIKAWDRVAQEYPASAAAPEALYKSGQIFETRIKNPDEARKAYAAVLNRYAKSDYADDSLMARANMQEEEDQYEAAVADFVELVKQYPDSPLADDALYRAADLCEGRLKDYTRAHELTSEFRKKFPQSEYLRKIEAIEAKTLKYAR